jgi:hypothetical protein
MPSYSPPPVKSELEILSYTSVGTVDADVIDEPQWILVDNNGYAVIRGYYYVFVVTPTLTITKAAAQRTANISRQSASKSATGKYVAVDLNNTTINVYKNGSLLQQLTKSGFYGSSTSERSIGISPNGKYIVVAGYNAAGTLLHVQVFQGY